ncbi:hypothetical protein M1349_04920 [Patescibacteria group bacterium]|nr:hypothetical protein [Patescibacteria group bacterium]
MIDKEIIEELKMEGASEEELSDFSFLMDRFRVVSKIERSFKHKRTFLEPIAIEEKSKRFSFFGKWLFVPAIAFLLFILIGGSSVIRAQESVQGEALYPVKILSEKAYSIINPEFKDQIIVRRSQEIKKLTEEKKDQKKVEKTIKDYQKETERKHSQEKIKESQENLKSAREHATIENKKEIEKLLLPEKKEDDKEVKGSEHKSDSGEAKENKESESR